MKINKENLLNNGFIEGKKTERLVIVDLSGFNVTKHIKNTTTYLKCNGTMIYMIHGAYFIELAIKTTSQWWLLLLNKVDTQGEYYVKEIKEIEDIADFKRLFG